MSVGSGVSVEPGVVVGGASDVVVYKMVWLERVLERISERKVRW